MRSNPPIGEAGEIDRNLPCSEGDDEQHSRQGKGRYQRHHVGKTQHQGLGDGEDPGIGEHVIEHDKGIDDQPEVAEKGDVSSP